MIKTQSSAESKFLRRILAHYYQVCILGIRGCSSTNGYVRRACRGRPSAFIAKPLVDRSTPWPTRTPTSRGSTACTGSRCRTYARRSTSSSCRRERDAKTRPTYTLTSGARSNPISERLLWQQPDPQNVRPQRQLRRPSGIGGGEGERVHRWIAGRRWQHPLWPLPAAGPW